MNNANDEMLKEQVRCDAGTNPKKLLLLASVVCELKTNKHMKL